jgi:hypothetical protein
VTQKTKYGIWDVVLIKIIKYLINNSQVQVRNGTKGEIKNVATLGDGLGAFTSSVLKLYHRPWWLNY